MNIKNGFLVAVVMAWGMGLVANPMATDKDAHAKTAASTQAQPRNIAQLMADSGKSNLNIRFVESFDTMRQCEQGVECGKSLEKTREQLSKAIQEDEQKLTVMMTEFQSKGSTLSAVAREKEEKKLRKMKTEYDTKLQESEYEMKLAMQKTTEELAQDMEKAVAQLAKREKYDAVVDTVTGRVLYVDEKLNVTQQVVKEMNTENQRKLAAAKPVKAETVVASNSAAPKIAPAA